MALSMHLHTTGSGMAVKTACGRNILRTPMSTGFSEFLTSEQPCDKCKASKTFSVLLRKHNAALANAQAEQEDMGEWEAIPDSETIKADKALIKGKQSSLQRLFNK